jgi:non-heme chloroperoxidase
MCKFTTTDGTTLFYKDWGARDARPILFHHGWPLSADDWDNQMLFFLQQGFRVIAHDRRGHGRSAQTDVGHTMDRYAMDVAELVTELDLRDAVHIGHSAGGGEVARYVARAETGRVAKAALLSAVTPIMVRSPDYPGGLPRDVFDGFRKQLAGNRAQFYRDVATGPFYGFNREGAEISQGLADNWWRQGMIGSAQAQYDGIAALSETDFSADLRAIRVPVLVLHGEDDQLVPVHESAHRTVALLERGELKTYPGYPHGMCLTHADQVNADLLSFIRA